MKRFSILIAALCLCLTGCGKQTTEATAQIFAMDTVMEVAAYGEHAEQAVKYTEKRIEELENRLSRTKADSLVSGLNRDGSIRHLTYDYWNLIARAKEYRDATNGAFDITIAPVMDACVLHEELSGAMCKRTSLLLFYPAAFPRDGKIQHELY